MNAENSSVEQTTILIVEDDETARWLLGEILAGEGYAVFEASTADEAMRRLTECPEIRMVISDIEMPGSMDGLEMAILIHRRSPNIGVLLTSGRRAPAADNLPPGVRFILKPWLPQDLIREIEALLAPES